jgi:DNA polymerase-3 subunit alpha
MMAHAQRRFEATTIGQSELFGGAGASEQLPIPATTPWLPAELLQKEYDAIGFFLSGHPLDDYADALKKLRVLPYAEFAKQVRAGATAGKVAATVLSRTERRTKTGNRMGIIALSDPSGHYEAVIFAEGLAQHRDMLEPGKAVVLFLTAEAQGEEVRARIQTVELLDRATEKHQRGLRVFVRTPAPLESVKLRLQQARNGNGGRNGASARGAAPSSNGDGEVSMVVLLPDAEVEVRLPGRFNVSPQIAGAIKAVPGVVTVEAV